MDLCSVIVWTNIPFSTSYKTLKHRREMALARFVATGLESIKYIMRTYLSIATLLGSLLVIMTSCVTSLKDTDYSLLLNTKPMDIHEVETRGGKGSRGSGLKQRFTSVLHAQENGYLRGWAHQMQSGRVSKLPWTCECETFWRDLGNDYKPRFIWDARCKKNTCMYGHYSCVPQIYEVNILRRIRARNPFEYDTRVADFGFTGVNVTVNCLCDRTY